MEQKENSLETALETLIKETKRIKEGYTNIIEALETLLEVAPEEIKDCIQDYIQYIQQIQSYRKEKENILQFSALVLIGFSFFSKERS